MPETPRYYYLGYVPSKRDDRDFDIETHPAFATMRAEMAAAPLPVTMSLRTITGDIMDQKNIGSCTAHSLGILARALAVKQGFKPNFMVDRLDAYYCARDYEGTVFQDAGASMSDIMKVFVKIGVASEALNPYTNLLVKFRKKPSAKVLADAKTRLATAYARVDQPGVSGSQNFDAVCKIVAAGYVPIIGTTVYPNIFQVKGDGKIGAFMKGMQPAGGHALPVIGYDRTPGKESVTVQNSWGNAWGDKGLGYLPKSYFLGGYYGSKHPDVSDIQVATAAKWR
jgi:C1A family cysteine protease